MKNLISRKHIVLTIVAVLFSFVSVYSITTSASTNAVKCPVEACVSLNKQVATPTVVTVTSGSYVQFNSTDGGKHNIALAHSVVQHSDESEFDSGDFGGDEAYKVQFKQDGAYTFRDKYNNKVSINVIVYTPGKEYKIQ